MGMSKRLGIGMVRRRGTSVWRIQGKARDGEMELLKALGLLKKLVSCLVMKKLHGTLMIFSALVLFSKLSAMFFELLLGLDDDLVSAAACSQRSSSAHL